MRKAQAIAELDRLIDRIMNNIRRSELRLNRMYSISTSNGQVLGFLHQQGEQKMKDIAAATGVDVSTATRLIDGMIERGLVQREHSKTDRRTVLVKLTKKGRTIAEKLLRWHYRMLDDLVTKLRPAGAKASVDGLRKLLDAYESM